MAEGDGVTRRTEAERFWAKVDRNRPDMCWAWKANTTKDGYGQFTVGERKVSAHRWSWAQTNGPIPDGMHIDHQCFMQLCVNPDHLRLVTVKQNNEHQRGAQANNLSSGIRGVTWHRSAHKWQVQVVHNGRHIYGGLFADLSKAGQFAVALRAQLFTHDDGKCA